MQSDVTERVVVEQERRAALADAEAARAQLRLLAEATTQMTSALDVADACRRFSRIVVPELADLCTVDLLDTPNGASRERMAVAARDADDEALLSRSGPLGTGRIEQEAHRLLTKYPVLAHTALDAYSASCRVHGHVGGGCSEGCPRGSAAVSSFSRKSP
ncbi:hypothetical protein [Pseudonocardia sp. ICBG601]|uniref:hypothetical protein n=1 Tax=Pseudonocardia sp. ICBG601 TaxID=2846759 RepID=UPI001CF6796D|nr:hypothetical protein [Pseudonocardia sp. ICBG601]